LVKAIKTGIAVMGLTTENNEVKLANKRAPIPIIGRKIKVSHPCMALRG
jgi:hypothetical protein